MLSTAPGLEQNPVNAARGETPFVTDSRQKRSLIPLTMLLNRAFERVIKSDYSPQTAIEVQLVSRLASLLWRLRRAPKHASRNDQSPYSRPTSEPDVDSLSIFRKLLHSSESKEAKKDIRIDSVRTKNQANTNITRSFLRLTNFGNQVFERLGRYETNLWRQTAQILLLLSAINLR